MFLDKLRKDYHKKIFEQLLSIDKNGIPSNADKYSKISIDLAKEIVDEIGIEVSSIATSGQTSGKSFETITADFLTNSFNCVKHLRAGEYQFFLSTSIDAFEQYEHLASLSEVLKANNQLRATLGDYLIKPDIVIGRLPVDDNEINRNEKIIKGKNDSNLTPLRSVNSTVPILHASISCKWTIRSDRSQNARTEGLNLIRNRKGHTPHIVIVTAEPCPQRIASLALGTGDIDCVYHFALKELISAATKLNNETVTEMLDTLVFGKRLIPNSYQVIQNEF